jgi:hypothetical protein
MLRGHARMPAATVATIFARSNNVIFSHKLLHPNMETVIPTILGLQDEHKAIKNGMQTVSTICSSAAPF